MASQSSSQSTQIPTDAVPLRLRGEKYAHFTPSQKKVLKEFANEVLAELGISSNRVFYNTNDDEFKITKISGDSEATSQFHETDRYDFDHDQFQRDPVSQGEKSPEKTPTPTSEAESQIRAEAERRRAEAEAAEVEAQAARQRRAEAEPERRQAEAEAAGQRLAGSMKLRDQVVKPDYSMIPKTNVKLSFTSQKKRKREAPGKSPGTGSAQVQPPLPPPPPPPPSAANQPPRNSPPPSHPPRKSPQPSSSAANQPPRNSPPPSPPPRKSPQPSSSAANQPPHRNTSAGNLACKSPQPSSSAANQPPHRNTSAGNLESSELTIFGAGGFTTELGSDKKIRLRQYLGDNGTLALLCMSIHVLQLLPSLYPPDRMPIIDCAVNGGLLAKKLFGVSIPTPSNHSEVLSKFKDVFVPYFTSLCRNTLSIECIKEKFCLDLAGSKDDLDIFSLLGDIINEEESKAKRSGVA